MTLEFKQWEFIDWNKVRNGIFEKQLNVFKAVEINKMLEIQNEIINHPWSKLLACRKVTLDNQGKRTPGIDGITGVNIKDRIEFALTLNINGLCSPIKRIYIKKPNGEDRPLGIPTIEDRAKQDLVRMALEPEWECKFEPQSFGFRPGRSVKMANRTLFQSLSQKPKFVLDADIRKCFDRINHETLINKLENSSIIKYQIMAWLRAGISDEINNIFTEENEFGTPQGGIVSPLLCNIALDGIRNSGLQAVEKFKIGTVKHDTNLINAYSLIRYADDFVAVHPRLDVILAVKEAISTHLKPLNLEFHPDKTRILHTLDEHEGIKPGFVFLSSHYSHNRTKKHGQYKPTGPRKVEKQIILVNKGRDRKTKTPVNLTNSRFDFILKVHPDVKSIRKHLDNLRSAIRSRKSFTQTQMIKFLNPRIRGWANFFSSVDHHRAFNYCDHHVFWYLYRWALSKHPNKGKIWVAEKYFHDKVSFDKPPDSKGLYKKTKWHFGVKEYGYFKYELSKHTDTKLNVTKAVPAQDFSPYNPKYAQKNFELNQSKFRNTLCQRQNGRCRVCGGPLLFDDCLEVHHLIRDDIPERNKITMMWLIHNHCHDKIHSKSGSATVIEEEPYEG